MLVCNVCIILAVFFDSFNRHVQAKHCANSNRSICPSARIYQSPQDRREGYHGPRGYHPTHHVDLLRLDQHRCVLCCSHDILREGCWLLACLPHTRNSVLPPPNLTHSPEQAYCQESARWLRLNQCLQNHWYGD